MAEMIEEEKSEAPAVEASEPPSEDIEEGGGGGDKVFSGAPPGAQEAVQKLLAVAMRIVYKKEVTQIIVNMIRKAARPEVGIAQAVLMVMKQIKDAAKGVPPRVIDSMAKPITMMVAELASKAGLVETTPEMMQAVVGMIRQAVGRASQMGQRGAAPQGPAPQTTPQRPPQAPAQPPAQPAGMIVGGMGG